MAGSWLYAIAERANQKFRLKDFEVDVNMANYRTLAQLTEGMSFAQFEQDQRTRLAVTKAIEIVGEAAKGVPAPVRNRHPKVPWKQMAGK